MLCFSCFAPLLFLLTNVNGQNSFGISFKNAIDTRFENLTNIEPGAFTSCYVKRLNASHDFSITCTTKDNCYIKQYKSSLPRPSLPPIKTNSCEPIKENKPPLVDKVNQLNAVLRMLTMANKTACDDFQFLETFQALEIQGLNLGQLGRDDCLNNVIECSYKLKFLNIVDNSLDALLDNSFCQFRQLEILKIANCQLRRIDKNAFVHLVNLTALLLLNNQLTQLHKNVFKNNLRLTEVSVSQNELKEIPPIGHLYNLKQLHVQRNRIGNIRKSDLSKCSQLSLLDLSHNQLSFIADGAFDSVRHLDVLDLSHNRLTARGANLINVFNVLNVNLDYNNFTAFSFDFFPRKVKQLSIRFNQIETYEDCIVLKRNLTSVDISNNRLVSIAKLRLPPLLQTLNLSSNHLRYLSDLGDIRGVQSVRWTYIDLRNNNITEACKKNFVEYNSDSITYYYYLAMNPLKCTCENMWLKEAHSIIHIKIQDVEDISCHLMTTANPTSAIAVDDDKNSVKLLTLENEHFLCEANHTDSTRCKCYHNYYFQCMVQSCPYNCTCLSDEKFQHTHFLCANKGFRQIPHQFTYKHVLKNSKITFDFSQNSIPHLSPIAFGNLNAKIVILILSNSKIESIEPKAFDGLIQLKSLNLGYNRLETLPTELFQNLTQLSFLDLANNRLQYLADDAFISISDLSYLYLHNNSLNQLELTQIAELKSLRNVTLHRNPWSCECAFILSFKAFLVNSSTSIHNKLELNCVENGAELNIPNFNTKHCFTQIHLTIIVVSLTIGLVIIITSGLMFKWRYELQVLVYAHYGLRMFNGKEVEEEVDRMQYDAFVAYNNDDFNFLFNDLLPGLETIANPYRLCIDQRDFPMGAVKIYCFTEAIEISSRTIILLSEKFVHCGWCQFVFKTVHTKMLHEKCPRLLVILVGEIPEVLDPEMKLYLKTNTYLKWGEKLFWQKLYYAMADKRVTSPATDIMPMREL